MWFEIKGQLFINTLAQLPAVETILLKQKGKPQYLITRGLPQYFNSIANL
ncbi:hypothetical protein Oweho_3375 [Owenweeksia hongkongensis DSM 17368]|uniref:Uncharacterized protein n=1 Tax=Owenweeksia hongkongensis (strain DSM 17368 / CIP 108786 / JCM 12287 / NRRL B-23963 / UST20020801) TaxID=926562 RepID=G8R511_OWEHD|nr:hypothetical protein Oweho_3375 [Owenweeksia hongkongensis DSM 17368]